MPLNIQLLTVRYAQSKTEINERKSIEYCALSNRVEAGITEQSPSRAAQNDRVLRAACGTPSRDAKRKSQRRNNFDGHRAQTARTKLKNPRAPNHFAPRVPNDQRKTRVSTLPTCCSKPRGRVLRITAFPAETPEDEHSRESARTVVSSKLRVECPDPEALVNG
jgi:hypothetical protein